MEVHLLGTAGYHPNESRHTACMMVPEAGVILDAGTGFFRVRELIQTPDLHIFLSHCHLDHCFGLSFYIDVLFEKNVQNVFVYGVHEKLKAIQQHLFSKHLFPLAPDFHWVDIDPAGDRDPVAIPTGGKVSWTSLQHPGGSLGFRLDWPDRSLSYITDTTAAVAAGYIDFVRGSSLLLHECHFRDGMESLAEKTGHSCLTAVAQVCKDASVERCVIVHVNPLDSEDEPLDLNSVQHIFPNLQLGQDRMIVSF